METTTTGQTNQTQARALLADIQDAPSTLIPRREAIVGWLNALLRRADHDNYVIGETETDDLVALDQFLRSYEVPVSARVPA